MFEINQRNKCYKNIFFFIKNINLKIFYKYNL